MQCGEAQACGEKTRVNFCCFVRNEPDSCTRRWGIGKTANADTPPPHSFQQQVPGNSIEALNSSWSIALDFEAKKVVHVIHGHCCFKGEQTDQKMYKPTDRADASKYRPSKQLRGLKNQGQFGITCICLPLFTIFVMWGLRGEACSNRTTTTSALYSQYSRQL